MRDTEESAVLSLDFSKLDSVAGCVPVVVQLADTREVAFVAFTDEAAMREAFRARRLVLYSTTRGEMWEKGATSGHRYELVGARVNCEQNSLLYLVRPLPGNAPGGICHTANAAGVAREVCYYREINLDTLKLEFRDGKDMGDKKDNASS